MTRRDFIAFAAVTPLLRGQSAATERGKKIVEDVIQALGGDAFRNMRTRHEYGRAYSFYREQLTGLSMANIYTRYLDNDLEQRQTFGKKEDDVVLLNSKEAWEITYRGAVTLGPDRPSQFHNTTFHDIFVMLRLRLNEPGFSYESRGKDVVENQPVEAVDFFDAENQKTTVWFHSSTMLPVKQSYRRWDDSIKNWREEVTRYTKYRDVGDRVMWPFDTQRERDTEKLFELYAEKITIGENMPESMFRLPPGIKIIKKKGS
jgi:hypothetical protein